MNFLWTLFCQNQYDFAEVNTFVAGTDAPPPANNCFAFWKCIIASLLIRHSWPKWEVKCSILTRNYYLYSYTTEKQSRSGSFTSKPTALCSSIKTLHRCCSLFSSSTDMFFTMRRMSKILCLFYTRMLCVPKFAVSFIELDRFERVCFWT